MIKEEQCHFSEWRKQPVVELPFALINIKIKI